LKILVINNYKELEKAKQALHNIAMCTRQQPEMLDHNTAHLNDIVLGKDPDIVILTGSNFMLSKPDTRMVFQPEMDLVRKLDRPFLGICFGHQLIGAAYGSEVVDLGHNVREYKEIKLLGDDPIFDGLSGSIRVSESHRQALTRVPDGFRHLAESATSRVEAIGHQTRPLYGLQFHPERSDEKHPHGRIILQNFLRLAAKF
jgi:GMP synthase-like glutamine amidotransferase